MRQIVLDTETTGLSTKNGHRIIDIKFDRYFVSATRQLNKQTLRQTVKGVREK